MDRSTSRLLKTDLLTRIVFPHLGEVLFSLTGSLRDPSKSYYASYQNPSKPPFAKGRLELPHFGKVADLRKSDFQDGFNKITVTMTLPCRFPNRLLTSSVWVN